jgi:ferredoxin
MEKTKLRIQIVREDCIGDGACGDSAPGTFCIDREGVACVRDSVSDDDATILKTARACPTDAIVIIDEESGLQLVPQP